MSEKRYQVFVSSTFSDLQLERQEVMHALLELDCIPSGMELFPAANESQWSLIERVIEDCDYYILILAGRYGSIAPDGLSYTEKEYRYALSLQKPTLAFLHREPGKIEADKTEKSEDGRAKLNSFRALVQTKICKHWVTPQELGSVVSRGLVNLIKTTPAVGWIRADNIMSEAGTLELLKLKTKVDDLTTQLERARTTAPTGTESLAQDGDKYTLRYSIYNSFNQADDSLVVTWNEIFSAIAPQMINEASDSAFKESLNLWIALQEANKWSEIDQFKHARTNKFRVNADDFSTVKVQLRALGLIKRSERVRSVKDTDTYWALTPYGDETMTRIRAIRRKITDFI